VPEDLIPANVASKFGDLNPVQLPGDWSAARALPTYSITQVLATPTGPTEVVLILGDVAHPVIAGLGAGQIDDAASQATIPINPVVKISISRKTLGDIRKVLTDVELTLDAIASAEQED